MKRFIILCSLVGVFAIYIVYENYQHRQSIKNELANLKAIINYKENELNRYQKINEKTLKEKLKAENKSAELIEQLNNALKNDKCSDVLVPASIADKLHNRAHNIRQFAKDSG